MMSKLLAGDGREQIALEEADAALDPAFRRSLGDFERSCR